MSKGAAGWGVAHPSRLGHITRRRKRRKGRIPHNVECWLQTKTKAARGPRGIPALFVSGGCVHGQTERAKLAERLGHCPSDEDIEDVVTFAYDLAAGLAEADRDFSKRRQIVDVLDVRGILAIEDGEKVCHASFILTGDNTKRLTLPKCGKSLSIASKRRVRESILGTL